MKPLIRRRSQRLVACPGECLNQRHRSDRPAEGRLSGVGLDLVATGTFGGANGMPGQPRSTNVPVTVFETKPNFSGCRDDVFKRFAADKAVDVSGNIARATLDGSIGPG